MREMGAASALLIQLIVLISCATAVDPVEVSGNKLFNKDGSQFFIKGGLPRHVL